MPSDLATEPPTPRRLRRARREGDHPISRALCALGALGAALLVAPLAIEALHRVLVEGLSDALGPGAAPQATSLATRVGWLVAPVLGSAALGAFIIGFWQTGGVIGSKAFAWDLARIQPFGRGRAALGERVLSFAIAFAAALATCGVAWLVVHDDGRALAASIGDARAALGFAGRACRALGMSALGVSFVAAAADSVLRHVAWRNRHRMTRDEVRREQRESEGDPELRLARQRTHRELASGGAPAELVHASLLVIGAPQLAVALRYDPARDVAPRVILSGQGQLALTLEALAASLAIPIEYDTPLAQALIVLPLDQEVPKQLYTDIARAIRNGGRASRAS